MAETGINFPLRNGRRGSTAIGKAICAEAVRALDPALASRIEREDDWRHHYPQHIGDLALVEAQSARAALDIARRGLRAASQRFVFVGDHGELPVADAAGAEGEALETVEIRGAATPLHQLQVPYAGRQLSGSSLLRQLEDWVDRGITEPSFADAVGAVVRNPDWLDLSDRSFALIGAGAEMGPFRQLSSWGARIAAIDIPRPGVWQRLIATARSCAGRMLVPVRGPTTRDAAEIAGVNLLTDVAAVRAWLERVDGPLTIGNYTYADGAGFMRLSMAFDMLQVELSRRRRDLSLAYLATPSDVFLVPFAAVQEARRRHRAAQAATLAGRAIHAASRGRYFRPNYSASVVHTDFGRYGLVNALVVAQGPNYALAKRLQRWRVLVARDEGMTTSAHVAPPTRTRSVLSSREMAERQRLTARLGLETFDAATSQALGAAILVHDLRNPSAPANPATPLAHPHELFMFAANPGGRWRVPFEPSSALELLSRLHVEAVRAAAGRRLTRRVSAATRPAAGAG